METAARSAVAKGVAEAGGRNSHGWGNELVCRVRCTSSQRLNSNGKGGLGVMMS